MVSDAMKIAMLWLAASHCAVSPGLRLSCFVSGSLWMGVALFQHYLEHKRESVQ